MNRIRDRRSEGIDRIGGRTMADGASVAVEHLRREPGSALAAIGAAALVVSLFLPWFGGVSGWNAFEVWDLVLAALAVAVIVALAGRLGLGPRRPDGWLWASSAGTVVIVVENLINRPPIIQLASAVSGARPAFGVGIWVALAAGVWMLAGTALSGVTMAPDSAGACLTRLR